jgi:hypothetical protein
MIWDNKWSCTYTETTLEVQLYYNATWLHLTSKLWSANLQNPERAVDQFDTVRNVKQQHEVHVGE